MTIAGSDSGGGAGIQADLRTFAVLGVWGTSAITSVTVQNTQEVSVVSDVPADIVAAQIRAVAGDIGLDAAKTGMLSSAEIISAVSGALEEVGIRNLVVDPVFVSKHGDRLLREDAVESLRTKLLPLASLVTPNLPEASGLVGFDVAKERDMQRAADRILAMGAAAALIKGGHLEGGQADDLYADGDRTEWIRGERIDSVHTHGTGCVLSAAVAAHLARGDDRFDAVVKAKAFVTEAIRHAPRVGRGIGPVDPGWSLRTGSRNAAEVLRRRE